MKRFLFLQLVVVIFVVLTTRADTHDSASGSSFEGVEQEMLQQCDLNFRTDRKDALRESYKQMMECFKKKKMFEVSKDEYIEHIEQCTLYTRANLKLCLTRAQRYIPEFIMDVDKELITFRYQLYYMFANLTTQEELNTCAQIVNNPFSVRKLDQCSKLTKSSLSPSKYLKIGNIPDNKETVCRELTAFATCLKEHFEQCKDDVKSITKYLDDFLTYTWKPCREREMPPLQRS